MQRKHPIDHVVDGGYKSRKMVMAYVIMALGVGAFAMTAVFPALAPALSELYMFLLGAASLFISGNVAVKWMGARGVSPLQFDPTAADPAPVTQKPAPVIQAPAQSPLDRDIPTGR